MSDDIEVTDELFIGNLEGRILTTEEKARARRLRWQWVCAFNNLKRQPGGGMSNLPLIEQCERVITIIDAALDSQPVIH